ncbi:hypothetical protein E27107_10014 [Elizabethkingia anophelis]|nr:hypothetical protein E18064_440106 [Elizabethkingia anophelis]CDN76612.1 hypothetical protein E27107_10014 [Elizabethkingia anophelis]
MIFREKLVKFNSALIINLTKVCKLNLNSCYINVLTDKINKNYSKVTQALP